jgi:hypothetical protein
MEHLLYENYSAKIWALAGSTLTLSFSRQRDYITLYSICIVRDVGQVF